MVESDREDLTRRLVEEIIPPTKGDLDDDVEIPEEVEQWVDETKGVERIISVAITTSRPRTAKWIAEQAVVSEATARDHLDTFAKLGVIASFRTSGVKRYHADEAFIHSREVSRAVREHSKEELVEMAESIKETLDSIDEEYDADSPDDLRARAAEEDTDIEAIRDLKTTASEWERLRDQLGVIEDAVRRFEKFDQSASVKA